MKISILNINGISNLMLLFTFQVCPFKNGICAITPDSWRLVCFYLLSLQAKILAMHFAHFLSYYFDTMPSSSRICKWLTALWPCWTKIRLVQNLILRLVISDTMFLLLLSWHCSKEVNLKSLYLIVFQTEAKKNNFIPQLNNCRGIDLCLFTDGFLFVIDKASEIFVLQLWWQ